MKYTCCECGKIVEQEVEWIDSGTIVFCPECDGKTIVDLWSAEQRDLWYERVQVALSAIKHFAAIRSALNFACYDKATLERCGDVWEKLFAAEKEFGVGATEQAFTADPNDAGQN